MNELGNRLLCFLFGHVWRNKIRASGCVWQSEPWCERCERWART